MSEDADAAPVPYVLDEVIARTGLDPWDAHVATVIDAAVYPSSPWTPGSSVGTLKTLTSRRTSSRSPTRTRRRMT